MPWHSQAFHRINLALGGNVENSAGATSAISALWKRKADSATAPKSITDSTFAIEAIALEAKRIPHGILFSRNRFQRTEQAAKQEAILEYVPYHLPSHYRLRILTIDFRINTTENTISKQQINIAIQTNLHI